MTLTDGQKKALMIGVPAVAVLALFTVLRKKTTTTPAANTGVTAAQSATDAATFAGQLVDFENQVGQSLAALQLQIANQGTGSTGTTAPTPAPTTPPVGPVGVSSTPTGPVNPYTVAYTFEGNPITTAINGVPTPIAGMLASSDPTTNARARQIAADAASPTGHAPLVVGADPSWEPQLAGVTH